MCRIILNVCLVLLAASPGLAMAAAAGPGEHRPPNILLIVSDDQGWTDFGFMGHENIRTPNLDSLARQGLLFRRGYVPTAVCRPSLMTLATGRYAHEHGVTGNDPSARGIKRKSREYLGLQKKLASFVTRFDTLPTLLAEAGYVSFQSGKWWEGSFTDGGFTDGMTRGLNQLPGARHGDAGLTIGRNGIEPIRQFADRARDKGQPFFIWYAPLLPHTPHDPPERLLAPYLEKGLPLPLARYYAMCEWFDETVGDLLAYLEGTGQRDNTLIAVIADNGWVQNPDNAFFSSRSKLSPYEGGVRTPIILNWPVGIKPGERGELATSLDLMPTLLAAAGASIPHDLPGTNLLATRGENKSAIRDAIFGEGFAHDIADLDDPRKSMLYQWVIEGRWKLILRYDGEQHRFRIERSEAESGPQLYDLLTDPHEKNNLAGMHPDTVARLSAKIEEWYPVRDD